MQRDAAAAARQNCRSRRAALGTAKNRPTAAHFLALLAGPDQGPISSPGFIEFAVRLTASRWYYRELSHDSSAPVVDYACDIRPDTLARLEWA
ncbi:MAG: hypothetical protein ACKVS9_06500 [Phycisphaerae bacterium]